MKRFSPAPGIEAVLSGDVLSLRGELTRASGPALEQWLHSLPPLSVLELSGLDIGDGAGAVHAFNAVRLLCTRVERLRLVAAPQVLAHNLYRTGVLAHGGIELEAMREDEAYG